MAKLELFIFHPDGNEIPVADVQQVVAAFKEEAQSLGLTVQFASVQDDYFLGKTRGSYNG